MLIGVMGREGMESKKLGRKELLKTNSTGISLELLSETLMCQYAL